jgi:hypothetical protein
MVTCSGESASSLGVCGGHSTKAFLAPGPLSILTCILLYLEVNMYILTSTLSARTGQAMRRLGGSTHIGNKRWRQRGTGWVIEWDSTE